MHIIAADLAQYALGLSDVMIIPNPNKGVFTIKGTLATKTEDGVAVEITDILGQVVYKESLGVRNGKIDEEIQLDSNLANEMYLLNLIIGPERKVFHFVLEK